MDERNSAAQPLKVFVSYSRADMAFADELVAGLEFKGGYDVTLDRHSIIEGEDWKKRLGALIADADTIVFLLSPDSAQSEVCAWEVEEAVRLSKRILPVLVRPLGDVQAPPALASLNYVRFDGDSSFVGGLAGLVRALDTDLDWLREHTRLLARAMEWTSAGNAPNRLLSGADVSDAKAWIANRPQTAPEPTDLHLEFIHASEASEAARGDTERRQLEEMRAAQAAQAEALAGREDAMRQLNRRTLIGLGGAGGLTALAGGLAYWGVSAEGRFRQAETARASAEEQSEAAAVLREGMRTDIRGVLAAYATSPGQLAMDGNPGEGSPFTNAVLDRLSGGGRSFQDALRHASQFVMDETDSQQQPFYSTNMNGEVYPLIQPASRRRKALCIAMDTDGFSTFPNVPRDTDAWAAMAENAGFETQRLANPNRTDIQEATDDLRFEEEEVTEPLVDGDRRPIGFARLSDRGPENTLALLFYSGAGFRWQERDYLMTTEAADVIRDTGGGSRDEISGLVDAAFDLTRAIEDLRYSAAAAIVVLDAQFNDLDQLYSR